MPIVTVTRERGVGLITLTHPPLGLMNNAMVTGLTDAVNALSEEPDIRALVITGGLPGIFVRHYDVAEIIQVGEMIAAGKFDPAAGGETAVARLFRQIDTLDKPVIAAINGLCMGGGFELALACDIRVAAAGNYDIGLPETRIGIFPGAGGTQRLARAVGEARALEMILRGRTVKPAEALSLGMVHELAAADLVGHAMKIGREFANRPRAAIAAAKALVKGALTRPLESSIITEGRQFLELLRDDPEAMAAMRAFLANGGELSRA